MKNPCRFPEEVSPPVYTTTPARETSQQVPLRTTFTFFWAMLNRELTLNPHPAPLPSFQLMNSQLITNAGCCCWSICLCSCLTAQEAKHFTDYCFHKWASFYFFIIILKGSHLFHCPEPLPPTPADATVPCSGTGNIWLVSLGGSGEERNIWLLQQPSCWGEQSFSCRGLQVCVRRVSHPMIPLVTAPLTQASVSLGI